MRFAGHLKRWSDGEGTGQVVANPSANDSVEKIHQLFPNLSLLEKFVLSTVLEHEHVKKSDDPHDLPHNPTAKAVRQYIDYLIRKEEWEKRRLEGNVFPMPIRRARQPE